MKRIILRLELPPGDVLMLTAAVRDLHKCYPGQFETDVRTPSPALWENNPYLTRLGEGDPGVELIDCQYPLIHQSNRSPRHFLEGFIDWLNQKLGLQIRLTEFKGDVHLSELEKAWPSPLREITGNDAPFWIVCAGGKRDYTIKWWDSRRYQEVVNHFRGAIHFAQIGAAGDYHPELTGVTDLRAKTDLRQLIRLIHHAEGVLCPVTFVMHLAAAVEVRESKGLRPCVVVAGGREPPHWEAYPGHQFLHTVGMLRCCATGGCWKARTVALKDLSEMNRPERLCVDVVGSLPRCMDMIAARHVIERIEMVLAGKAAVAKRSKAAGEEEEPVSPGRSANRPSGDDVTYETAWAKAEEFIRGIPPYPENLRGRGIVICAGGLRYFANAWVCIRMLRWLGCELPIQLWHLGSEEMTDRMRSLVRMLAVECVDANETIRTFPARLSGGWPLKAYAVLRSPFKEVLLLDADNVPVKNPEYLFDARPYLQTGAVFWPDFTKLGPAKAIWNLCGVAYRDEAEFETGQIVVDKERCWPALSLCLWYNEHSEVYYPYTRGDKETFHMAFRKLEHDYAMPNTPILALEGTMCQHDFEGQRVFQHRNMQKWTLVGDNKRIAGFWHENECLEFLEELRVALSGPETAADLLPILKKPKKSATARLAETSRTVVLRTHIVAHTGYGLLSLRIAEELERAGYDIRIRATNLDDGYQTIPRNIRMKLVQEIQPEEWELLLHPPNLCPTTGKRTIYFTMWEATRLPRESIAFLNAADHVVVPCQWNASCFNAVGVERPISVVPLGVDSRIFKFVPMKMGGPCVFGTAGRMRGCGERKGLNEVIELFRKAFPSESDVRLRVKGFPDCGILPVPDPRIEITTEYLSEEALSGWYGSLTCFVSMSRAEGWGMMPHQAMAVGRPCIAVKYGGHAEFLSEETAYCVNHRLLPARFSYAGCGHWAEPDREHLIELMREVHGNRERARTVGVKAGEAALRFTWKNSAQALLKVLREAGAVA